MGADYSFELNSIETFATQFFGHNNLFLGSVHIVDQEIGKSPHTTKNCDENTEGPTNWRNFSYFTQVICEIEIHLQIIKNPK